MDLEHQIEKGLAGRRPARGLAALGMDWAGPPPAVDAAPEPPVSEAAASAAGQLRSDREHQGECEEELFEGANCSCGSIERFGPPSERESYWDNL